MAETPKPQAEPAGEQHPVPAADVPGKRSVRERASSRPFVTAGVAAFVAFCVAGVGGYAIGHAVGDDGPRDSIARFDDGGHRGDHGRGGFGFGGGSQQGPGGEDSQQGRGGEDSEQRMDRERPDQDSTQRPDQDSDGDVPATPEQDGAAAQL
ncbi:hypothetical protein [Cellulomonas fengjieae]|uniref:hypothetical protein n=1 Tax=Cellulomonas fengjieae TaxID=2819978 RepID=UPI001AB01688|nr:hypothetical protein [Cellulomonas fengjieae]MBO3102369.1 hypothetical protein [Cellulomonas fengjieae]